MTAFSGVRVLDFSSHFAAAMAGMHLADFHAEVIKIDPTLEERARTEPGYLAWNRNKKRLALNLSDMGDLARAHKLLEAADVAVFDANPGILEEFGLSAAQLTQRYVRLIHVWAPPYGEKGVWSALPASHTILTGLTGAAFRQSSYADQPVHLTTPQAYYGQANMIAAAIAAALVERQRSGLGQGVVVSGLHGAAQVSASAKVDNAPPMLLWGAPLGGMPSYRLYQCADGEWFFLGTLFQGFFMRALEASGVMPALLAHPLVGGDIANALKAPGSQITLEKLEAAFRSKPRRAWLDILAAADVPCGPVRTRADWFASETIAANAMRLELDHPEFGRVAMPGVSAKLSKTPGSVRHLAQTIDVDDIAPRAGSPPAPGPKGARRPAPLAGIRVLDMGAVIAGAYTGAILAGFGADVIKIEPADGDPFRSSSAVFGSYNRGKRGLVLDLKRPEAKAVFFDLAKQADIVLDNYRLGVRERLGLGYEALREVNPNIISLSITGYGVEGPQASLPGFDPLMQAQSGLMHAQGGEGGEPVFYQIAVNDVGTASMSAFALIAALYARTRIGEGQEALTSLASQSLVLQIGEFTTYEGAPAPILGARDCLGAWALERFYACADGWIALACNTPERARAVGRALSIDIDQRGVNNDPSGPLAETMALRLAKMPRAQALERLLDAGAPAAPAIRGEDTFSDAFLEENEYFDVYEHGALGLVKGVKGYARFSASVSAFPRAAPGLGEHSREVLRAFGLSADRIEDLIGCGAVKQT